MVKPRVGFIFAFSLSSDAYIVSVVHFEISPFPQFVEIDSTPIMRSKFIHKLLPKYLHEKLDHT